MNKPRVTLADVAAKAGVHPTTVSLALRNHPRLPEATRKRLQALAAEMDYRPDPLLRALHSYRRNIISPHHAPTLAYVTNWNTRWGWKTVTAHPDFYAGAAAMADQQGYQLEHFWLREPGLTHQRLSRMLYSRGINGLIFASHDREIDETLQFDWANFAAVKIDHFPHQPGLHNVTNNQFDIVRLAMQKMMAAGYRRIGLVMDRGWDHSVDHLWTAGYLCEQQHLSARERLPSHIFPSFNPVERWFNGRHTEPLTPDFAAFARWFRKHKPEALISKDSFVLPLLEKMGVRVPDDVALVDIFLDKTDGIIAGVKQNHRKVGEVAVRILAEHIQYNNFGIPEIPTTTFIDGTWFDGISCPPRVAGRIAPPYVWQR